MTERSVWKFRLVPDEWLTLPELVAPRIVHVGHDPADPQPIPSIWVDHGDEWYGDLRALRVTFVGTGHPVPQFAAHAGSCIVDRFVWHVYYDANIEQDL